MLRCSRYSCSRNKTDSNSTNSTLTITSETIIVKEGDQYHNDDKVEMSGKHHRQC